MSSIPFAFRQGDNLHPEVHTHLFFYIFFCSFSQLLQGSHFLRPSIDLSFWSAGPGPPSHISPGINFLQPFLLTQGLRVVESRAVSPLLTPSPHSPPFSPFDISCGPPFITSLITILAGIYFTSSYQVEPGLANKKQVKPS